MKKAFIFLLAVYILLFAVGCSVPIPRLSETVFSIEDYRLQLTANSTFKENTGGEFDLQITNDYAYISVMAYNYSDLSQGLTPPDVYDMQNEDLFSKRTDVVVLEEVKTQVISQRTVMHTLFSAKNNGVENYYTSYLVDLPYAETFAWVLVSSTPSYYTENKDMLHSIVCSLTSAE